MSEHRETRRQNIEQQRANAAWEDIQEVKRLSEKEQKEYRSQARGLNAMIQINGLGQTLGFLHAKGGQKWQEEHKKNAYYYLLSHLTNWMHSHFNEAIVDVINEKNKEKNDGLLDWIVRVANSADYRRATTECLAFGGWLGRFAEAELKGSDTSSSNSTTE